MKRRFAVRDGRGVISVREEDIPPYGPNELLVEVRASVISAGTELIGIKELRKNPDPSREAVAFGYQNAGVVLEKGKDCGNFEVGDRVACMGGGYALHATHSIIPRNLAVPIPDNISFEEAAVNHLAVTALQAIRRTDLRLGETLAVAGLGIVGQIACQLGRLSGCRVVGMDLLQMRLECAKKSGAHMVVNAADKDAAAIVKGFTEDYGLDAGIMALGGDGTQAFKMLLDMMKVSPDMHQMGRIVVVGGCEITTSYASSCGNIDVRSSARTGPGYRDKEWEQGRDYPPVFVQWDTKRNLSLVLRLISEGQLQVKPLITHRFSLSEAEAACEELIQHPENSLMVVLSP